MTLCRVYEEQVPIEKEKKTLIKYTEADTKRHSLLVCQIGKRMSFPFSLDIRITPSATHLFFRQLRLPLLVQTDVDPTEDVAYNELHNQNDHDGSFTRDVFRGVLGLKNLRADDVAHTKDRHRHRVYRHL